MKSLFSVKLPFLSSSSSSSSSSKKENIINDNDDNDNNNNGLNLVSPADERINTSSTIYSTTEINVIIHTSKLKRIGIYEIHYIGDLKTGIMLRNSIEHKFPDGELNYVIDVGGIADGTDDTSIAISNTLSKLVEEGDILVKVNRINVEKNDLYEVAEILNELKEKDEDRILMFLKPRITPLDVFLSSSFSLIEENNNNNNNIISRTPSVIDDDNKSVRSNTSHHSITLKTPLSLTNIFSSSGRDRSRQNTHRSIISTVRSNNDNNNNNNNNNNFISSVKTQQQDFTIIEATEEEDDDDDDMEQIPTDLSLSQKRVWMDLIDLRNCERSKDRIKFWKHRKKEFQRSPLPLLLPKTTIISNDDDNDVDNENNDIDNNNNNDNNNEKSKIEKNKIDEIPLGVKFKKLMNDLKWYEKQYLIPESPNTSVSLTRTEAAKVYLEEKIEIMKYKQKKREIKKQIARKVEVLGKEKETDIILSLVEQQEAKKIPSRTVFITTTKGETKVAKTPPPPSEQMRRVMKAQEDAKRQFEIEKENEENRKANEKLNKRSSRLVDRLINRIVDIFFEECTQELCDNIAEVLLDNYCINIIHIAMMEVADYEIAEYVNTRDCIDFYEDCLVIKEKNMCERAADLIFKAVFEVELYLQSKELFKRMADVQLCEKAAERFIKERIKKEIEFDRQEMMKRTEFFANQTVTTILTKECDGIVTELFLFDLEQFLLIMNDIDARNKYEIELIEEVLTSSINNIFIDEMYRCITELTEFLKELEFQVLLSKNDKVVDIIMDCIFNDEISDAIMIVDDSMYDDLEDFLILQESAAQERKIERRLLRIIERVFTAVYNDCTDMELHDLIDTGIIEYLHTKK